MKSNEALSKVIRDPLKFKNAAGPRLLVLS